MTQRGDRGAGGGVGRPSADRLPDDAGDGGDGGEGGEGCDGDVDWRALRQAAHEAMSRAYAPYSGFPVGAAARVDDGRTVSGCNVENVSYGLGLCAECGLVSQLRLTGGGRLTHFTCVNAEGEVLMPCGRCRQLLYEFGGPTLVVETPSGPRTLDELLPDAFGPEQLGRTGGVRSRNAAGR